MSVSCDRCSERTHNLNCYENMGVLVLCHACADEVRNEK